MMQAVENGLAHNFAFGLNRSRSRRILVQRHMRASNVVVVVDVVGQYGPQVVFAEDNDMI